MRPRVAVVLFNLGGPDRPEAIWPFLLNLFNDPAILRVPFFSGRSLPVGSPLHGLSRRVQVMPRSAADRHCSS